jgi:DegV family protein with EDD domain
MIAVRHAKEVSMTVAVVTDSTSALPLDIAQRWGIRLVSLTVTIGGQAYRDSDSLVETALANFVEDVHTAGVRPGEFLRELTTARHGDADDPVHEAVIVTVTERLSSINASARLAAGSADLPVEVVDSGSAAGGLALVAIAAAKQAKAGGSLAEVAETARNAAATVRLLGCMKSLDRLVASGRIPSMAGAATRRLGLWPMFELRKGSIRPMHPARSIAGALERIAQTCVRSEGDQYNADVADLIVLDAGLPEEADAFLAMMKQRIPTGEAFRAPFSTAMTVHTGSGVIGLAWRWRHNDVATSPQESPPSGNSQPQ